MAKRKTKKRVAQQALTTMKTVQTASKVGSAIHGAAKKAAKRAGSKRREGLLEVRDAARNLSDIAASTVGDAIAAGAGAIGNKSKWIVPEVIKSAANSVKTHARRSADNQSKLVKGVGKMLFNDLSWYNHYPDLAAGMIGPNFNRPKGAYEAYLDGSIAGKQYHSSLPTVAGLRVSLTVGDTTDHAFTSSVQRIYATVRKANTGATNGITVDDYIKYILSIRAVVACFSVGRWAYGTINKYTNLSVSQPVDLFAAKGLDYDTFANNAANLRNKLNTVRSQFLTYASLSLDLFKRTEWLFSGIYADSDDAKAQLYTMSAFTIPYYDYTGNFATVSLRGTPTTTTTGMKYQDYINALDQVLLGLTANAKNIIIAGDIIRAFGEAGINDMYTLPEVSLDYTSPCGFVPEVLTQIQNATLVGDRVTIEWTFNADGIQESVTVATDDAFPGGYSTGLADKYMNMYKDNISNLDVIAASRFMATATPTGGPGAKLSEYGTEIVSAMDFVIRTDNTDKLHGLVVAPYYNGRTISLNTAYPLNNLSLFWAAFDWAPKARISQEVSSGSFVINMPLWDFNNYAYIGGSGELLTYHRIATMSLLYVPMVLKQTNNVIAINA